MLLGERRDDGWRLRWIWPCCNVWPVPGERCRRFAIDPREQLLAQKWGRVRGLEVLGAAHSHPSSPAVPSAIDLDWAVTPCLMLIVGPRRDCRAWWVADAGLAEVAINPRGDR